jgi:hypothetical protein
MPPPPEDAQLEAALKEPIPGLANLYDQFAFNFDPFSSSRDEAEANFQTQVAQLRESLPDPKPDLHAFRKAIILRCRHYLKAVDKPSGI